VLLPPLVAKGTVPGPRDDDTGEPTPPCKVQMPMRTSVQLADIDTLLNTSSPLEMLRAMVLNNITQQIGQLRYDQYFLWVNQLRDDLERYLRLNAVPRTGLQVLEVFIEEPQGQSEADKRQLKLYQVATEIKNRVQTAKAANKIRVEEADAARQEAELLGVQPWINELSKTPEGVRILEADLELRKMAIAAGMLAGEQATLMPPQRQGMREYDPSDPASGYSSGAGARPGALPSGMGGGSQGGTYPGSYPGASAGAFDPSTIPPQSPARVSESWPGTTPTGSAGSAPDLQSTPISGQFRPAEPTIPPEESPVDEARLQQERQRLPQAGYTLHETKALVEDGSGRSTHGYEFTLTAQADGTTMLFDLLPGYPAVAPVVWVKRPGEARASQYRGQSVRDWTASSWLGDVLAEIMQAPNS
jgi:hypothetical protein